MLDPEGRALNWNPLTFFGRLPEFVYRHQEFKPSFWGTVRMETPVIYFHADDALAVDARVGFPGGTLTEWYPAAEAADGTLAWNRLTVLPRLQARLPISLSGEHYYAARGVDATHLQAQNGEIEKFLFYRGVGSFEQPLTVRVLLSGDERAFALENRGEEAIERVFLFEKRDGSSGLLDVGPIPAGGSRRVARSALALSDDLSLSPLEDLLRAHGLFEDEAQAMLATWRGDWFERGLRAFYVMPRTRTDALLPLALTPPPRSLVRVLVGRLELIEPELEREILDAARATARGKASAGEGFAPLGYRLTRFALAVLQARYEAEPDLRAAERALMDQLSRARS